MTCDFLDVADTSLLRSLWRLKYLGILRIRASQGRSVNLKLCGTIWLYITIYHYDNIQSTTNTRLKLLIHPMSWCARSLTPEHNHITLDIQNCQRNARGGAARGETPYCTLKNFVSTWLYTLLQSLHNASKTLQSTSQFIFDKK